MPKVTRAKPVEKQRDFVFTVNNYTDADFIHLAAIAGTAEYLIYGHEIAPQTGTPHLQGYVYFKNARTASAAKKIFAPNWTEFAKGDATQNTTYCSKDGQFKVFGKCPKQGARNDIHAFVLTVQESQSKLSEATLLLEHSSMAARYPQFVDRTQRHFHPPKDLTRLDNLWCYGPPGTGKTHYACEQGTFYIKAPNKWHCGYAGEDNIIVEDIEPKHASFLSWFLKIWGDKRPYTAQTKGSSVFIRPKRIIVTSNYSIEEMCWDEVTTAAISRRFERKFFAQVFCEANVGGE